ncbi:MAG: VWA domain-containing protein [Caldilineaceae bacterium]|nr:VWA domain-containing protein [Caldilineaceae bacterium]
MNQRFLTNLKGWVELALVAGLVVTGMLLSALPADAAFLPQLVQQPNESGGPTQPIDVVVVLDDSGSMATCWPWPREGFPFEPPCRAPSENPPSDPDELRYSAARLLLQLSDDDDRLAVVRFDSVAEGVGALGALTRAGDGANRQQLAATIQPPSDYMQRGYTRIDLGLEQAINLLGAVREPGRSQYVLLLTDGEPTEQGNVADQKPVIVDQLATLRQSGVLVFPVVLCNPSAGCSGEFLREQFAQGLNEAKTPQDLLRIFSEILTQMKPDRSLVVNRNPAGQLQFTTRDAHGVRSLSLVTTRNGLVTLRRDEAPMLSSNVLNDPNIDLNVLASENLAAGIWDAETVDPSGFVVVQAASYPQLLNPPPSLANSPASVRYYPAGKPPLLIARANGPGVDEPLIFNGDTTMEVFGQDNTRALLLTEETNVVRLQLGADAQPLQLERAFRLEARSDLPEAQVFLPRADNPGLLEDGRAQLQVGFSGANVSGLAATAYVLELAADGSRPLAYQANMQCDERTCTDTNFKPVDGRAYEVTYIIQGQVDDVRFGDWAQAELALSPAVYLRGLPAQLDLAQMPAEGWPVELGSGTLEEIGSLAATIVLRNAETGEEVPGVVLDFVEDVPEEGTVQASLRVVGLEGLRPGAYEGEIQLQATNPAGRPMDVNIRPGATLPVSISVARPLVRVESQAVDFGEVLFDTSPNFRLDRESFLPLTFVGKPFKLSAELVDSTCSNVSLVSGDVVEQEGRMVLPLHLTSAGPVMPATCQGSVVLRGPNGDYDVTPSQFDWQARVASVEWSIVSGDLHLGDLQDVGARATETLLIRFNGKTPFVVQLQGLKGTGATLGKEADTVVTPLGTEQVDVPSVEISGPPNEAGLYEVPLTMIARQAVAGDQLRGTLYTGQVQLAIAGLPNDVKTVGFSFRSPSIYQRYVAPIVVPVYSLPAVLCTGPLTLLILLVVMARVRSRSFDDNEIEEAAVAATRQAIAHTTVPEPTVALPTAAGTRPEVAWGSGEFGNAWSSSGGAEPAASYANGAGSASKPSNGDPWTSGW